MGIFDSVFGNKKDEKNDSNAIPWKKLTTIEQVATLEKDSLGKPQAIFKHSTTCGISRMVLRQLESQYDIDPKKIDIYYLDLKAFREVSNNIAERFAVQHQSPQLLLIKNGTVVYAESHGAISASDLAVEI